MIHRRDFHRIGTFLVGGLMSLVLAVPGVAYLLSPILKKKTGADPDADAGAGGDDAEGGFFPLARLSELTEGVPRAFPVSDERVDAWVKYPREPIGSVWLIRQPSGAKEPVVALTAECPHLGCAVNLAADGHGFHCPCHNSSFTLEGAPTNPIPPRSMDTLQVTLSSDEDPWVRVRWQRFRTQSEEKIPLG